MMKNILLAFVLIGLFACKKEYKSIYQFPDRNGKASIKIVHAVTNALSSPTTQAGLQVYINDAKLTGSAVTFGGGVFPGLEYALVPSGSVNIKAVVPASGTNPEALIFSGPVTLEGGKTYTAVITDTLPSTSIFLVTEELTTIADSGKYFIRLINATPKSVAYDLYGVTDAAMISTNVAYKTAGAYVQIFAGTGARTFAIRKPGNATNIVTIAITPVPGRAYNILSHGIDGGTGARAPKLAFFTSRFQQ